MQWFISVKANLKSFSSRCLHEAAEKGDAVLLERLLQNSYIKQKDLVNAYYGDITALHIASSDRYHACMATLLEHGANPSCQVRFGSGTTPLHRATREADESAIRLLLMYGADANLADEGGTPKQLAAYCSQLLTILLQAEKVRAELEKHAQALQNATTPMQAAEHHQAIAICWLEAMQQEEKKGQPFLIRHYGKKALAAAKKAYQLQPNNQTFKSNLDDIERRLIQYTGLEKQAKLKTCSLFGTRHLQKKKYQQLAQTAEENAVILNQMQSVNHYNASP